MRRRVLTILILLLAGAVVNVGVAWGCAIWINVDAPTRSEQRAITLASPHEAWIAATQSRVGATLLISRRNKYDVEIQGTAGSSLHPKELLPDWSGLRRAPTKFDAESCQGLAQLVDTRGWPLRALWSEPATSYWCGNAAPTTEPVRGGIRTSLRQWTSVYGDVFPRTLPLRPIWPNFVANTLFYAIVIWVLAGGPFALRRDLRVRRGLCPKCAYPMSESAVCSECGATLATGVAT